MKTRMALATLFAAALLAAVPASYAAVGNTHSSMHAMFFHGDKKVKFNLSNQTGAPLELKVGDQVVTLQAGQVMPCKLPLGARVTTTAATDHHPAGEVIVEARVSRTGNALAQPGDLFGRSGPIKPGATGLRITIDQVMPNR